MFAQDQVIAAQLWASLGHVYAMAGQRAEAQKALDELMTMSKQRYVPSYLMAKVYAGLGDKDAAFAWLEKAFAERYFLMIWINAEPQFDPLRSDPRFSELLRRIGLPSETRAANNSPSELSLLIGPGVHPLYNATGRR